MFNRKKWEALNAAIAENDAEAVTEAAGRLSLRKTEKYYEACLFAVEQGADQVLNALLEAGQGYDFCPSIYSSGLFENYRLRDKEYAVNINAASQLIDSAYASPAVENLLSVLYAWKETGNVTAYGGSLDINLFLRAETPFSLLETVLKSSEPEHFRACLWSVGMEATEKLGFILTFATEDDIRDISEALVAAVDNGDRNKAELLLKHGADVNLRDKEALVHAAKNGDSEMVALLLPHATFTDGGDDIVTQLTCMDVDSNIIKTIQAYAGSAAAQTQATAAADEAPAEASEESGSPFTRIDSDTLAETQTLPNGSVLTTLFNFRSEQQRTILDKNDGSTPAIETVNFNDIKKEVLERMRSELDALNAPPTKPAEMDAPATETNKIRFGGGEP